MAISYLFCEGTDTSLDRNLLELGILPHTGSLIWPTIVAVGGKHGMINFINGYFSQARAREGSALNNYMALRDRDFDLLIPHIPERARLHFPRNPKVAYLHRITIENYFLTPKYLYQYLVQSTGGIGRFGLSSEEDVRQLMQEAAEELYYYTIARHTIGAIKHLFPIHASTWLPESGQIPQGPSLEEASILRLLQQHFSPLYHVTAHLSPIEIAQRFHEITSIMPLERFLQPDSPHDNYQTYCHGKDLKAAVEIRLAQLAQLPAYTLGDRWQHFALNHFDYTQFPDLAELRTLIAS